MGKNELGQVFDMAGRSYLFFLSFGQSHINHSKAILIVLKFFQGKRKESAQKILPEMKGLPLTWVLLQVGLDGSIPGIPDIRFLLPSTQKPDLCASYPNGKGGF